MDNICQRMVHVVYALVRPLNFLNNKAKKLLIKSNVHVKHPQPNLDCKQKQPNK